MSIIRFQAPALIVLLALLGLLARLRLASKRDGSLCILYPSVLANLSSNRTTTHSCMLRSSLLSIVLSVYSTSSVGRACGGRLKYLAR
ncbi:hypothetical protein BD289DRAFT_440270 [Coniella lustricola]|uniref:Secreted protein n=1 Tax=Coniella lustricola TaxID=2025994 RepID=A0A2T3A0W0_9PEZI|nr:hypothetical protein BD289DRAFT_440270 [Coniella lustricola]